MKRPMVTEKVIGVIATLLDSQDRKGFEKYGVSIDQAEIDENGCEYDWNVMCMEEMADGLKYLMKENEKLRKEIKRLRKEGK